MTGSLPRYALPALAAFGLAGVFALTDPSQAVPRVSAVCAVAVLSFSLRLLPDMVTVLLAFLAFLALGAAPVEVIFSGFSTGGFWLLFSGLVIGAAITGTGLGRHFAQHLHARTGSSYWRAALMLSLGGLGLGVLVPSTIPRIIVIMPVAAALAATMGFAIGSRGQVGLALAAATSTLLPTFAIITANLPTIVQYGALEALYGIAPSYGDYLLAQAPVNLLRLALILAVLLPFARGTAPEGAVAAEPPGPMTAPQRRLLLLIGLAIAFWVTDGLHHISPAWVALSVATVLLWPGSGILDRDAMKSSIDLSPAFFLAGIFAVSAVARHVGLDAILAEALIPRLGLGEGSALRDAYAIFGFSNLVSHLTTAPAAPVVLVPLAGAMAEATGWPIETVSMMQVVAIATPLLPYEAPPLIVALALAHIPVAALVRLLLVLAAGSIVIGVPLCLAWWRLIGIL